MQFNTRTREVTLKVVYYGPALSGKTTNIEALHGLLSPDTRGRLMTLDTRGDRTLFFDLLPVHFITRTGYKIKLKLFTVPGQVVHESTRRIVLQSTDAVCFIADGQRSQRAANNEAFSGLRRNLGVNSIDPDTVPTVIQFNKLDLPDVLSPQEIEVYANRGTEPVFRAIALRGEGVLETLQGCLSVLWRSLEQQHGFSRMLGVSRDEFLGRIFHPKGGRL
ncbi:MAG: hypothetical protein KTR25_02370 [Myxococcales bacterium]|nr:hypothetical protein [Myxococcales bacterium]